MERCGAHAIHSLVLHERWVLLVVAREPLISVANSVMVSAAKVLAPLLASIRLTIPPLPDGGSGGGGSDPTQPGISLWRVRKAQS